MMMILDDFLQVGTCKKLVLSENCHFSSTKIHLSRIQSRDPTMGCRSQRKLNYRSLYILEIISLILFSYIYLYIADHIIDMSFLEPEIQREESDSRQHKQRQASRHYNRRREILNKRKSPKRSTVRAHEEEERRQRSNRIRRDSRNQRNGSQVAEEGAYATM